jgi:hypothetical protein
MKLARLSAWVAPCAAAALSLPFAACQQDDPVRARVQVEDLPEDTAGDVLDASPDTAPPDEPDAPLTCQDNLDCRGGEVCREGRCVVVGRGCQEDLDCAGGERCLEGRCAPISCVNDEGCDPGELCHEGACVAQMCSPGSRRCAADGVQRCDAQGRGYGPVEPCGPGAACAAGACVEVGESCPVTVARASQAEADVPAQGRRVVVNAAHPVALDGSLSSDDGAVARVTWSVLSGPAGWLVTPSPEDPKGATLTGLRAGSRYVVAALAEDDAQTLSCAQDTIEIYTVDEGDVVFHLLWGGEGEPGAMEAGADLDLRLLRAVDGAWGQAPYDVFFGNPTPRWPGGEEARLVRDAQAGPGPEVIVLDNPAPCQWYSVGVHYWQEMFGAVTAELRVFVDGALVHTQDDLTLAQEGAWREALVLHWPSQEIFVVEGARGALPQGQRALFPAAAVERGLCGLVDEPEPSSCGDHLGEIGSPEEAAPLGTYAGLQVCAMEDDYFATAPAQEPGARVFVEVSSSGAGRVSAELAVDAAQGRAVAWSQGLRTLDLPAGQRALLRVGLERGEVASYGLRSWSCPLGLSGASARAQARALSPGNYRGLSHCGGQSWWKLAVPDQHGVLINFAYGFFDDFTLDGALLTLVNAGGDVVAQYELNGGSFGFLRYELPGGDYYLRLTSVQPDMAGVYHVEYELVEPPPAPALRVVTELDPPFAIQQQPGAAVSLPVRVFNDGEASSGAFQIRLYQVMDLPADPFTMPAVDPETASLLSATPQEPLGGASQRVVSVSGVPIQPSGGPDQGIPFLCAVASAAPLTEATPAGGPIACVPLLLMPR